MTNTKANDRILNKKFLHLGDIGIVAKSTSVSLLIGIVAKRVKIN